MVESQFVNRYWTEDGALARLSFIDDNARVRSMRERFPTIEAVEHRVRYGHEGVVRLLVAVADGAPSDDAVARLAALIRTLLEQHADRFLEDIVDAARASERFRAALAAALTSAARLSDGARERLDRSVVALR